MLVSHCIAKSVGNSGTNVYLWLNEEICLLLDTPFGCRYAASSILPFSVYATNVRVSVYCACGAGCKLII